MRRPAPSGTSRFGAPAGGRIGRLGRPEAVKPGSFEKLVVGFDGTDTGWDGVVLSMALAKTFGSQLSVV